MYVLKQGRVFNFYAVPVDDPHNPPDNALMGTEICESEALFRQKYPQVRSIVEKKAPEPPTVKKPDERTMKATMDAIGIPKTAQDALHATGNFFGGPSKPSPTPEAYKTTQSELGAIYAGAELQEKAVQEFKILLARYYANKKDEATRIAAQAVANFILSLWPDLGPTLQKAKDDQEKPAFSL